MNKFAFLLVLLSLPAPVLAASTPPKVVFIGDYVTYEWTTGFAANPNWINKGGSSSVGAFGNGDSSEVLARFQTDVVDLHPAIVHIMIGEGDADAADDATFQSTVPIFLNNLNAMVKEAKAANIQVILGIEAPVLSSYGTQLGAINSVIASYGAANNIPVVNYGQALCGCVGATLGPLQLTGIGMEFGYVGGAPFIVPNPNPSSFSSMLVVSTAGYALMTQMARNAIATINLTLQAGYLQDVQQINGNVVSGGPPAPTNVNSVYPGAVVQFTPVGRYSDGSYHTLLNPSFEGSTGTWTSSNPLVMYVNQTGLSWANSQGTAIIRYTPPNGVKFSEWILYVKAYE